MKGYDDSFNTMLLPPREPGSKLPQELLQHYEEQTRKLEEAENVLRETQAEGECNATVQNYIVKGLFTLSIAALLCRCVERRPLAKAAKMTGICQSALSNAARTTQQALVCFFLADTRGASEMPVLLIGGNYGRSTLQHSGSDHMQFLVDHSFLCCLCTVFLAFLGSAPGRH